MGKELTKSQIEQIAVNKVENICLKFNRLQPLIKDADKIPCIDGQIIVRSKSSEKKEDIIGYITVQVKGTKVKKFDSKEINFSVDIADLKNYKIHDGIIFFVVQIINSNKTRMFYNTLLPFDLEVILKQAKGQKTKTLKFKELNTNRFLWVCQDFLNNKNDQKGIPCSPDVDINNITQLQFSATGNFKNIIKNILNNDVYVKGLRVDTNQYVYFQKVQTEMVEERKLSCVTINKKQYYDTITIQHFRKQNIIKIGKSTIIRFEFNKPPVIDYKICGNIYERINDLKFLIDWEKYLDLHIDDNIITILENKNNIKELKELLKNYNEIKFMLDYLNVELSDDIDILTADDKVKLDILLKIIVYKQHAIKCEEKLKLYNIDINNKSISVLVITNNESQEVVNYFEIHKRLQSLVYVNDEPVNIPCYNGCKAEHVINQLNFDIKSFENSIIKCQRSETALNSSINLLLEMIKCYDIKNDTSYLESCERVSNYLMDKYNNNHSMVINHFQIIKRKRELTLDEKGKLISMKDESKDDYKVLCGINAVLGNKADFDYYFSKLDGEDQDLFKSWAIYKLIKT